VPVRLALATAARLADAGDRRGTIVSGAVAVPLDAPRHVQTALAALASTAETEDALCDRVLESGGLDALQALFQSLAALADAGLLQYVVIDRDTRLLAAALPWGPYPVAGVAAFDSRAALALSPYAYLRSDDGVLLIESPLTRAQVRLHDPRMGAFVAACAAGAPADDLASRVPALDAHDAQDAAELLWHAGMLAAVGNDARPVPPDPALDAWEFHDLLFHARSRGGRHAYPSGQTFRLRGRRARPPVIKPPGPGVRRPLFRPDLAAIARRDPPLTTALESRRSRRVPGPAVITADQLGAFLYRSARVKEVMALGDSEVSRRPYPSGGASYELEIYAAVRECAGLDPGLYRYCPDAHALEAIDAGTADVAALLDGAATAAASDPPQVLLILAARFARVSWKYSSIAYAVMLKNAGALYQTMYLVAEAMGLAACALGNGDSDRFARAAGVDYYEEGAIGEFMLSAGGGAAGTP
jgi:SagB-type dehydrogenase family enzyme